MTGDKRSRKPLRAAAEAELAKTGRSSPGTDDATRMVHELEVHRIELEMQNDTLRQIQAALAESCDRYADLYEFAPIGYLALNHQGRIVRANLAAAVLLGMDRSGLISRPFARFVAAADGARWHWMFDRARLPNETRSEELRLQRDDDSAFQARIDCRSMVDEVLLTLTDISAQKRIETQLIASEERYLALFRDASDAIAIADANGRLEEVNPRFVSLLGYDLGELCGASIERLHPAEELPQIRKHFEEIVRDGRVEPLETKIVRKDGQVVAVEIRPTQIEIGGRRAAQGIFIDLTERKRLEQQRVEQEAAHRVTLVREVHHRIKNNLQSVAGLLQRELGKFPELGPPLQTAISQLNAIAVVHGLQSAGTNEAIRLCESIRNICRTVADLAQRPVSFLIKDEQTTFRPVYIECREAVSIALALNELILNAVKHSPEGSVAATVSLSADGGSARLVIRNALKSPAGCLPGAGQDLGTGLRLVRSLLPATGVTLVFEQDGQGFLLTRLTLKAPVVANPECLP